MLDVVINNVTYQYVNSVKIDDNCYIAYTDGQKTFISQFYYVDDKMIIKEIDEATFLEVSEVMA